MCTTVVLMYLILIWFETFRLHFCLIFDLQNTIIGQNKKFQKTGANSVCIVIKKHNRGVMQIDSGVDSLV